MKDANGADEIIRLRSLLGRYADHVENEEGLDFLHHSNIWEHSPITQAEGAEVSSYRLPAPPTDTHR
jgi:hypothetical protein